MSSVKWSDDDEPILEADVLQEATTVAVAEEEEENDTASDSPGHE